MRRREFLKLGTVVAAAWLAEAPLLAAEGQGKPLSKWRGVNLGGWLALERWITPTVYAGVEAEDEYTLCEKLGKEKATARLKKHREQWITDADFRWLADSGLNAVRLPVGYAVLEESPPFISAQETLSWAFGAAKKHGLGVLLDLHGVPGSQNGWDHSGRAGKMEWHTSKAHIDRSVSILENLAQFCKGFDNLIGLQLVNEPHREVPSEVLRSFYQTAYERVRKHLASNRVAIVFHDGFRPHEWGDFFQAPRHENVVLDTHMYQCFTAEDQQRPIHDQIELAVKTRKGQLDQMRRRHRCIVGEWSCGLPDKSLGSGKGLALDTAMRAYAAAQLLSYETSEGWFFWTYRTEKEGGWNFRDCVERGWLPQKFNAS
jgi:glucan 1,3-beta-glucosidase